MKTGTFIGIDFGTTNTAVVSILNDEHGSKVSFLGEEGEPFSSIVAIPKEGDTLLFGRQVRIQRLEWSTTHDIFLSMKSYLGTDKEFIVGDQRFTATDIATSFMKHIRNYVAQNHEIEVSEAVFAFPANFSPEARRELKKAAENAGIKVKAFVSEATAAYIANRNVGRPYSKVMVIDWGGGTLDISILDLKGNKIYESAVWGEKIGGDDIDLELAQRMHARFASASQMETKPAFEEMTPAERDQMIMRCEEMKKAFTYDDVVGCALSNYGVYGRVSGEIEYGFFKDVITPIIKNKVLKAIDTALERSGTSKAGIDAVIVAGGSCDLRPFEHAIINIFGEEKIVRPEKVQWSVATGTALIGIMDNDFYLNDDLCVLLSDDSVYPIFEKDKYKIGHPISPITFALTEDDPDAHFIFCNGEKNIVYAKKHVWTKGYLKETLVLDARIGEDQIAEITVSNPNIREGYQEKIEINKLTFYYDLGEIGGSE